MQQRLSNIWRLVSNVGVAGAAKPPVTGSPALAELFRGSGCALRSDPETAARQLRALILAVSHPAFYPGEPMSPREIVQLLLHGIRLPAPGSPGEPAR